MWQPKLAKHRGLFWGMTGAILLPVILGVLVYLCPIPDSNENQKATNKANATENTESDADIFVGPLHVDKAHRERETYRSDKTQDKSSLTRIGTFVVLLVRRWVSDPIALFTYGILVVSAALAYYTYRLWWSTKGLVEDARDVSRRQLRPYVSISPAAIANFGTTKFITIECITKNHGQTPAFEINHVFDIDVFPAPLSRQFVFPKPTRAVTNNTALFPNADMKTWFNAGRLLSHDEVNRIRKGTSLLLVWGKMSYVDTFREPLFTTEFNFSVSGETFAKFIDEIARGNKVASFSWSYEANHNRAT